MTSRLTLSIERLAYHPDATLGIITLPTLERLYTLEPAWRGNQRQLEGVQDGSCIPEGHYLIARHTSHRWGTTWRVENVCGRHSIIFHPGNTKHDTVGCILPGLDYIRDSLTVASSRKALDRINDSLVGELEAELIIKQFRPEY